MDSQTFMSACSLKEPLASSGSSWMARFIVRPLAEADLEDAAQWYADERAGLVETFLSDVDHTFARLKSDATGYAIANGSSGSASRISFLFACLVAMRSRRDAP
jgi:hypothetical protein